ncbi:MAG: hypothetical protein V7L27_14955 [Nostoc sp.]|uniref:hypothetical protein n=1 Tax=Nostoc sp. TaxID=1180 RepID=UPI002FF75EC8
MEFSESKVCLVPSLRLGMLVVEAPPRLLAAEPSRAAFPAGGWKRGFKGVAECQII